MRRAEDDFNNELKRIARRKHGNFDFSLFTLHFSLAKHFSLFTFHLRSISEGGLQSNCKRKPFT